MFYQATLAAEDPYAEDRAVSMTDPGFNRYIQAVGEEAGSHNPVPSLARTAEDAYLDTQGEQLQPDVLNQKYGIAGRFQIDRPMTDVLAKSLYERKKTEIDRQSVIERGGNGLFRQGAGLVTGFATTFMDPLNVGLAFVPALGEERIAAGLGMTLDTIRARAGVSALVGGVQAGVAELPVWYQARQEYADYTAADSLTNIAFGVGAGGVIGTLGGVYRNWIKNLNHEDAAALKRAAIAKMADGEPVHLDQVLDLNDNVISKEIELGRKLTSEEKAHLVSDDPKALELIHEKFDPKNVKPVDPEAAVKIGDIYDRLPTEKPTGKRIFYGSVDSVQAQKIYQETGLKLGGLNRTIDDSEIKHIRDRHGPEGHADHSITKNDMGKIPEIASNPDVSAVGARSPQGLETIVSVKKDNGYYFLIEEVRTGRGNLATKTFFKVKERGAKQYDPSSGHPLHTSNTLSSKEILAQYLEKVKRENPNAFSKEPIKSDRARRLKEVSTTETKRLTDDSNAVATELEKVKSEQTPGKDASNPTNTIDDDIAAYEKSLNERMESNRLLKETEEGNALLSDINESKTAAEQRANGVMSALGCLLKNLV